MAIRLGVQASGSEKIQDGSVTESKIAAGSIDAAHFKSGAVVAGVAAGSVTSAKLDSYDSAPKHRVFKYSFAVQGGSISAITLTATDGTALTLPDNANIRDAWIEPLTTATSSGSATIALGITGSASKFLAATAFDHGEFTVEPLTVTAANLPYKTSAAVSVLATIAGAALTAGIFNVHVVYTEGQ